MFLTQLDREISDLLDELVLKQFGVDRRAVISSKKKFNELIDVQLTFPAERLTTLKKVIEEELLSKASALNDEKLIRVGLPTPRSALLFGPPGTSKSRLAKAIAEYLGWPIIVITPSEFLGKGLEQVHAQVDERFRDLMDLRKAVVFFDEMDALAQTREGDSPSAPEESDQLGSKDEIHSERRSGGDLDVTRQLLTTSMLPKLANLWDQRRVIFLMATNHKQHLDPAITRPNRFDLLLCVAPPAWTSKVSAEKLAAILSIADANHVEKHLLRLAPKGSKAAERLDLFTVAELGIFLHHLKRQKEEPNVLSALKQLTISEFDGILEVWAATSITLRTGSRTLAEFKEDVQQSRRQYYPDEG